MQKGDVANKREMCYHIPTLALTHKESKVGITFFIFQVAGCG